MSIKKIIYVAEDQPDLAEMVRLVLVSEPEYEPILFNNGLDVYRAVRKALPHLLVIDILLPELNGLAVTRLIKYDFDLKKLPILVMSSIIDPDIDHRARHVGADFFLPKPFEVPVLLDRVRRLLTRS